MGFQPLNLELNKRKVYIIGAGKVALDKLEKILPLGADVTVISKEIIAEEFYDYHKNNMINLITKEIELDDIVNPFLIIAATNNSEINEKIFQKFDKENRLVNSVDDVENCNFIFPAVVDRGDLKISISTTGANPILAVNIKNFLSVIFNEDYNQLMIKLRVYRNKILSKLMEPKEKMRYLKRLVSTIEFKNKINFDKLDKEFNDIMDELKNK